MSAQGGTKQDLLKVIRTLQDHIVKLKDETNYQELCFLRDVAEMRAKCDSCGKKTMVALKTVSKKYPVLNGSNYEEKWFCFDCTTLLDKKTTRDESLN